MAQPALPQILNQDKDSKPCYLECLAPELLDLVFFEIDSVRALANLITTAGFVHHRFAKSQRPILWHVIQNELGPVVVDARFLRLLPYTEPVEPQGWGECWPRIHDSAALYKDMVAEAARSVDARLPRQIVPSLADMNELCHTLHDMNFLADTYLTATLQSWGSRGEPAAAPPSRTERLRVLRAFYRRQIASNAWAATNRELDFMDQDVAAISNTSDHQGVRLGLLGSFEPWELQHIDHANGFILELCVALYFAGKNQSATRPIDIIEFGSIFSHADQLVRYIRGHPSLAGPALDSLPSRLGPAKYGIHEAAKPSDGIDYYIRRFSLLPMDPAWQCLQADAFPDPAREKREADSSSEGGEGGASLRFIGDAVDLPTFGWVDSLGGRYVRWFGEALGSELRGLADDEETREARYTSLSLWRNSGFTFWDRSRVEAIKELSRMKSLHTGWVV